MPVALCVLLLASLAARAQDGRGGESAGRFGARWPGIGRRNCDDDGARGWLVAKTWPPLRSNLSGGLETVPGHPLSSLIRLAIP